MFTLSATIVSTYNYTKKHISSKTKASATSIVLAVAEARIKYRTKDKKYNYWVATRMKENGCGYVYIGAGIEISMARTRMTTNRDVFCSSNSNAKHLAKTSYLNKKPVGPEIHGGGAPGYYWHYHVNNRKFERHAFF